MVFALWGEWAGGRMQRNSNTSMGNTWKKPDPGRSLQDLFTDVASELVAVDGQPGRTAAELHASSNKMCLWQCLHCGNQWRTTPNARTNSGSGCPKCARQRTINARRTARAGESLADMHPEVAAEFVENLDNDLLPSQLRPHSSYKCRWRCHRCGNEWVAALNNRTSGETGCPACFEARRGEGKRRPRRGSQTAHEALGSVAIDFVRNETSPGFDLTMLRPGSSDRCTWKCSKCGHTWIATVNSRVRSHRNRDGSGCRKCYDRRISARRRAPKEGESLAERYPQISQSFVRNLTTPGAGPLILRVRSNDRCLWRCKNGHEWETNVLSRTYGSGCPKCTSAGRSRFELEVQSLLTAATGVDVICDYVVENARGKSGRLFRVDLFVPSVKLHVDLDPFYTHNAARHQEKDARKSTSLKDLDYVRLRAKGLPGIPGEHIEVSDNTKDGIDPWTWTASLQSAMVARGLNFKLLNAAQRKDALAQAADTWASVKGRVRFESTAQKYPDLIPEFKRNLTRLDYDLTLCSPSSFDVAEWQCSKCQHVWQTMIRNRSNGSGCHACHRQGVNDNNVARSMASPHESLADLRPHIAARFIQCLKDASRTPENLRLKSNLRCEWFCHTGQHTFIAPVFAVSDGAKRRCCK
ncbi:zinc-ribbon domain-containing protein [Streptomyces sp. NPDC003016]